MKNETKRKYLPLNLQFFAEGGEGASGEGEKPQITLETVQSFLESNEQGKKWLSSQKDSHFSKSLETWKQNNLDELVQNKYNDLHPPETEEVKKLREMEQKLQKIEKEKTYTELKNQAISTATEKGLPVKLVDFFVGENQETTTANLSVLEEVFESAVNKAVDERFKNGGRNPKPGDGDPNPKDEGAKQADYAKKIAAMRNQVNQNQNKNPYFG